MKVQKLHELWQSRNNGLFEEAALKATFTDLERVPDGKYVLRAQRNGEQQEASRYLLSSSTGTTFGNCNNNRFLAQRVGRNPCTWGLHLHRCQRQCHVDLAIQSCGGVASPEKPFSRPIPDQASSPFFCRPTPHDLEIQSEGCELDTGGRE